ncbi:unnamed protein product, partial [Brassica rapa]
QPTWTKITQTIHRKGQRAESKDQHSLRGPKSPKQSTGRASVQSPRTNVLICVLMYSHRRPVCADGHTRTATDMLCMLTDTHGRPVCADRHPRTSCVRHVCADGHPPDVLCVLNRQPTWAKITRTVHGKGQRVESKDQCADMCTDGQPQTSYVHTRTATHVLCVLTDTHGRPVCAEGHPLTSCTATDVLCVLTDSHGQPQTSCVCWRTPTDVLCVLNRLPTWAKITQTVHGKGQRAESKDQRADMCTDGEPRTSCLTWAKITRTVQGKGQRAESKDQRADLCTDGQPWTSCVC